MKIPPWVVFLVAGWVLLWGAYRIGFALRQRKRLAVATGDDGDRPSFRKKGLWAQSPRRHMLFGCLYLILGCYLVAMGFGYGFNFRSMFGG